MGLLYIAEKPDIGRALAGYLWSDGEYEKVVKGSVGYLRKGDTTVTWARGHILALAMPEKYGEEFKTWRNYPIFPKLDEWILYPPAESKAQFEVVRKLLKENEVVVHAGDPDREGQLLIDEILDYCNYKGKVRRILINAKDDVSMKRAFDNISDNEKYKNLYYAGKARAYADWLVGINLSRAYSVNSQKSGFGGTYQIGRVKTPTLALVVNREKEIKNFKPQKYYELYGTFNKDNVSFNAKLKLDKYADENGYLKDKKLLEAVSQKVQGQNAKVLIAEKKMVAENAPLPFSLDSLQVEANKVFGYSPKDVLATVQALYEAKYVSYPRSDCNFIPASQHEDSKRILNMLKELGLKGAEEADSSIRGRAFNDNKITAHHAIIPTGITPKDLDEMQGNIYKMIARQYVLQFFPPAKYISVKFALSVADEMFTGSGKVLKEKGYLAAAQKTESTKEGENVLLPTLEIGDILAPGKYKVVDKVTHAPKRFTEGTLLAAMANIYKFVSPDNPNRDKLKEVKGIGTPATRDTIIAELQGENAKSKSAQACIQKLKNKELVPTEFGTEIIENVDVTLTKPDLTAVMEYALSRIEAGTISLSDYLGKVMTLVRANINYAEKHNFPIRGVEHCPSCKDGVLERRYSKTAKKFFYLCSNGCSWQDTNKPMIFDDENGKPLIKMCPADKSAMRHVFSQKKGTMFWYCPKCEQFYSDKFDSPKRKEKK